MFGISRVVSIAAFAAGSGRSAVTRSSLLSSGQSAVPQRAVSSTSRLSATRYLLSYEYVPDVLEKRGPYREGHLELANKMIAEGKCLSGGPTGALNMEVPTGALFVFTDVEAAKQYVDNDPYVANGIVTGHTITEWNVVVEKEN